MKFADLAKRSNLSMSYLVNQAIDRMLAADSIDVYRDSMVVSAGNYVDSSVGGMTRTDIERLVKSYVDSHNSSAVAEEILKTSGDATVLEELVKVNVEPLADLLAELETYTQSQFAAVRDELKKPFAIAR